MQIARILVFHLLLMLLAVQARAQDGTDPVQATDLLNIRQLGDVAVSPDQRYVAYTVRQAVEAAAEDGEVEHVHRTHIYLASADGREEARPITRGRESAHSPVWHPSGDQIAFVRAVDGTPQIFVLPFFGGEAYQLTDMDYGATAPRWSPDGSRLLFASVLPGEAVQERSGRRPPWSTERPGAVSAGVTPDPDGSVADVRAWLQQQRDQGNPRVFTRLDLQGEHDLEPRPSYRHLFVKTAEPDAEPIPVTRGFRSFEGGSWGSDGETVYFSGSMDEEQHPDRVRNSDLLAADIPNGNIRSVLNMAGYALSSPQVSPEGDHLAFLARPLENPGYTQSELGLYALEDDGASPELLTEEFDRSVSIPRWDREGWYLFFTAASEGGFPLYRAAALGAPPAPEEAAADTAAPDTLGADSLASSDSLAAVLDTSAAADTAFTADTTFVEPEEAGTIRQITGDTTGVRSFDIGRAGMAYVLTRPTNPYELYAATIEGTSPRPITAHNASWLADKRLSRMSRRTLTRGDTLEVDYWTMRPAFYEEGQSYPLLLQIHGDPMAMAGPGVASSWHELQFFASRGYGIVFVNPRGSAGYGQAFQQLSYQDWGAGPASDVLAAAAEAAELPWLDADRQVVSGSGSYAGYLTAWIAAHDDRFRAAAAQHGVYDLATFLGEGSEWRLVPEHFGGYPWESEEATSETTLPAPGGAAGSPYEALLRNSPLTYVDQIDTPLLIMHSDSDLRTGAAQSETLYKSLQVLEKPVEYVRYPNAGHDLSRTGGPLQQMDRILRLYEFFERYL